MSSETYAPTIRLSDIATHAPRRDSGSAPRRIRVLLNVSGGMIMRGHTIHIATDRLIVSVPSPIDANKECAIFFGLTIGEQIYSIIGTGQVEVCSGNAEEGYRAEMKFSVSDRKSQIVIAQLFSRHTSDRVQ